MNRQFSLREINSFDQESFINALSSLFEGPPWIVEQAWQARPFKRLSHLHQALSDVMRQAPIEQRIALIQAHPDLVGRAALAGALTLASTQEQASAGLDHLTAEEIEAFTRYNQAYRERFDFPFVICARENKKERILAGFKMRLQHTRNQEIEIALDEIARICWLRLQDTVQVEMV